MTTNLTDIDDHALTLVFKTMGLEDRPVDQARTVTVGAPLIAEQTAQHLVAKLPRLLRDGDRDTVPELKIMGTLGEGGMGRVELAEQLSLGREVAVKKVRKDSRSDRTTLVLLREGWTTGLLEHPNIVPVYSLGRDDDGEPLIVMKKIGGTSWLSIIEDPSLAPEPFQNLSPLDLHLEILSQICNALAFAHARGIIHRDLKPENVMIGEFGEVYVLDWGIAVALEEDPRGRLALARDISQPAGTPAYMAPEMVDGDGEKIGVTTDIFLLGATLHEVLTGEPPYSGKSLFAILIEAHDCHPPTFDDSIPEELAAICRRAMAREPQDRSPSASAFREALQDFRRTRQARRLADRADARRQELTAALQAESEEETDDRDLYKIFGECRFAYEQSLEIDPGNDRATRGLQAALQTMADRELRRGALNAAQLLITDFPTPSLEYQNRLVELSESLSAREEEFQRLQQISHDTDLEVGRASRALFAAIMGTLWGILTFGLAMFVQKDLVEISPPRMLAHILFVTALLGVVIYLFRDRFFANEVNTRMIRGVFATFLCASLFRGMSWLMEIPHRTALASEILLYGTAALVLAATVDRRLIAIAAPLLIAAIVGAAAPSVVLWAFATANVVGMGLLAWIWWPDESRPCRE